MLVGGVWEGVKLSSYLKVQGSPDDAQGRRAREVVIDGRPSIVLTAFDTDTIDQPNDNPRVQPISPKIINPGEAFRLEASFIVMTGAVPLSLGAGKWVEFLQVANGDPFAGSPPLRVMTTNGTTFGIREADRTPFAYEVPLERDALYTFVFEWLQSTKGWYRASVGKNGAPPVEVIAKKPYATIQASNGAGPNMVMLDAYMQRGTAAHCGPVAFSGVKLTRIAA